MHYLLLCNNISKKSQNHGLKSHHFIISYDSVDWLGSVGQFFWCMWYWPDHSRGSFSWEAWQGLCIHDGFVRMPVLEGLSICLSLPPFFSPSSILTWTSLHGGWNTKRCNVISTVFYWSKRVNILAHIWGEGKQTWSACLSRAERNGRPSTASINNVGNQACLCSHVASLHNMSCDKKHWLLPAHLSAAPSQGPQADWPESGQQMRPVCHPSHKGM